MATSFFYSFGTKLLSLLIILISRILTARMLGPVYLGSLGNALNFITIISRWGSLGIAPAIQFTSSKYSNQKNTILVYAILISAIIGFLNLLFLINFNSEIIDWQFYADNNGGFAYAKFLPWMPLVILSMTLPIFLLGLGEIKKYSFTQIVPLALQTLIIATAYSNAKPFETIIWAQIANWVFTIIIALTVIDYKFFKFKYDHDLLIVFIKYALNAWPQIILQFGISRFAVLIGSRYLASKDLGYYILASNLSESFLLLTTSASPLIFNRIASRGTNLFLLKKTIRISNTCLLLASIITISFGKPIFIFFFRIEFDQTWRLLHILFATVFFQGMIRICITYIAALGNNRLVSTILLAQLTVLYIVSEVACPRFGNIGLCYATTFASVAGFTLCLHILRKSDIQPRLNVLHLIIINKADIRAMYQFIKEIK